MCAAKLMRPGSRCRDRKVADLITAAGASAPADAVFGSRFATGETPRPTTSASEADKGSAWPVLLCIRTALHAPVCPAYALAGLDVARMHSP